MQSLDRKATFLAINLLGFAVLFADRPLRAQSAGQSPRLKILHFSDLHGQLRGDPVNGGGYARLAQAIKEEKLKAGPTTDTVVIFGGDALGKGALPCRKTEEKACVPLLKDLGIDVAVLGNGELKRPVSELNSLLKLSGIPVWISPNVKTSREEALWQKDYKWIAPKSGAEFMIASWTLIPSPGEIDLKKAGYIYQIDWQKSDLNRLATQYSKIPVIWAPHQSFSSVLKLAQNLCELKPELQSLVILHSNTHRIRQDDQSSCLPIYESGAFAGAFSKVELHRKGQNWVLDRYELISLGQDRTEDPIVKSKVDELYRRYAPEADELVAELPQPLEEVEVAQWFAEALRKATKADLAIVNSGAIKMGFQKGALSRERLLLSIPYKNDLMGLDWKVKDLEKSLCDASRRQKIEYEDHGSELFLSGAQLLNAGAPDCRLEGIKKSSVKVVLENFLVRRSQRWLGKNIESIAFKFGLNTEQAMNLILKREGVKL